MARPWWWGRCVVAGLAAACWAAPAWGGIVQALPGTNAGMLSLEGLDDDCLSEHEGAAKVSQPPTDLGESDISALLPIWAMYGDFPADGSRLFPVGLVVEDADLAQPPAGAPARILTNDDRTGVDRVFEPFISIGTAELNPNDHANLTRVTVPEPSVLLLMLLGLPAVLRARRRRA